MLKPLVNWRHVLATISRMREYSAELGFAIPEEEEAFAWSTFAAQDEETQAGMLERSRLSPHFDLRPADRGGGAMQAPPMIAGLYRYVRDGKVSDRWVTPAEIRLSLEVNPSYRDWLLVLAGDGESADVLGNHDPRQFVRPSFCLPESDSARRPVFVRHGVRCFLHSRTEQGRSSWESWLSTQSRGPTQTCPAHGQLQKAGGLFLPESQIPETKGLDK